MRFHWASAAMAPEEEAPEDEGTLEDEEEAEEDFREDRFLPRTTA